jgi:protein-tyrosine phosphatase
MNTIRPWLYVGTRRDTMRRDLLYKNGITAMLQLAREVTHPDLVTKFIAMEDGKHLPPELLREGLDFVLAAKEAGHVVLIACEGGYSRSVVFAVAALREAEGLRLSEALGIVKQQHPDAEPHPTLWKSLCDYYQEGGYSSRTTEDGRRRRPR